MTTRRNERVASTGSSRSKAGWIGAAIASTALALTLLAASLLSSAAKPRLAAAGLAVLGLASVLHPAAPSSWGLPGGCAALLVAATTIRLTLRRAQAHAD